VIRNYGSAYQEDMFSANKILAFSNKRSKKWSSITPNIALKGRIPKHVFSK
jgi:hypothetical protein